MPRKHLTAAPSGRKHKAPTANEVVSAGTKKKARTRRWRKRHKGAAVHSHNQPTSNQNRPVHGVGPPSKRPEVEPLQSRTFPSHPRPRPTHPSVQELWERTKGSPRWRPTLFYCGSYDDDLRAFPVKFDGDDHLLWIPRECKFALRFMNHVTYCLWFSSLSSNLPERLRRFLSRVGEYTDQLRTRFFDDVCEHWYPPGTRFPTDEKPVPQRQPLRSRYLTSFMVLMFKNGSPTFERDDDDAWPMEPGSLDPADLDWNAWADRTATNRTLFGAFPDRGTGRDGHLLEENRRAGIPNAPSVEIDTSSWFRYTAALLEEYTVHLEQGWDNPPAAPSHAGYVGTNEK